MECPFPRPFTSSVTLVQQLSCCFVTVPPLLNNLTRLVLVNEGFLRQHTLFYNNNKNILLQRKDMTSISVGCTWSRITLLWSVRDKQSPYFLLQKVRVKILCRSLFTYRKILSWSYFSQKIKYDKFTCKLSFSSTEINITIYRRKQKYHKKKKFRVHWNKDSTNSTDSFSFNVNTVIKPLFPKTHLLRSIF